MICISVSREMSDGTMYFKDWTVAQICMLSCMWNTSLLIMITLILLPWLHLTYYGNKHFTVLHSDKELICLLGCLLTRYFIWMCLAKDNVTLKLLITKRDQPLMVLFKNNMLRLPRQIMNLTFCWMVLANVLKSSLSGSERFLFHFTSLRRTVKFTGTTKLQTHCLKYYNMGQKLVSKQFLRFSQSHFT